MAMPRPATKKAPTRPFSLLLIVKGRVFGRLCDVVGDGMKSGEWSVVWPRI